MATVAPDRRPAAPAVSRRRQPVEWWALVGALFLIFWTYVLLRWVLGENFQNVPGGPDPLPDWMNVIFIVWQAVSIPIVATALYFMVVKPYRRTGRVPLDGYIVIGFILMSLQDAVSDIFGWWYSVNAHLVNMGSFVPEIPGWQAYSEPGAVVPWVPLFQILWYPLGTGVAVWSGTWIMRRAYGRWGMNLVGLMALVFPVMMLFDLVLEGFIASLLGFYVMPGGHLSLFPDAFHKFPFIEAVFVAAFLTPLAALRFQINDRGESVAEAGTSELHVSSRRRELYRFLAVTGCVQAIFLVLYNIPIAGYMGANPGRWPETVQSRSYWNDHLCGGATGRLCPEPGIPLTKDAWVNDRPDAPTRLEGNPKRDLTPVPNDPSDPPVFNGPLLGTRSD